MGQRTKYPMLISTCPNTNSSCKVVFNRIYFALRLQNVQLHLSSNVFTCHSFLWEFSLVPKNHLFRQVSCVWRTFVNYVAGWTKRAPNNITTTRGVQNKLQLLFTTCSIIEWFTGLMCNWCFTHLIVRYYLLVHMLRDISISFSKSKISRFVQKYCWVFTEERFARSSTITRRRYKQEEIYFLDKMMLS